jgi:5-methylcytosine-specific restriction endonuclease McrA
MTILSQKLCLWCSKSFDTSYETKVYCHRFCKEKAKQARKYLKETQGIELPEDRIRHWVKTFYIRNCKNCGQHISTSIKNKLYCDKKCSKMLRETIQRQGDIKRLKAKNTPNLRARIYYRDKGICGICKKLIDLRLEYPNPYSMSIDHIVPVSQGGTNNQFNLQPAHLVCNSSRGNKPLDK